MILDTTLEPAIDLMFFNGPIVYSSGLVEVMLLDAGLTYPKHKHNPEELYVVQAGKVWWETETVPSIWRQAGEVTHHSPT